MSCAPCWAPASQGSSAAPSSIRAATTCGPGKTAADVSVPPRCARHRNAGARLRSAARANACRPTPRLPVAVLGRDHLPQTFPVGQRLVVAASRPTLARRPPSALPARSRAARRRLGVASGRGVESNAFETLLQLAVLRARAAVPPVVDGGPAAPRRGAIESGMSRPVPVPSGPNRVDRALSLPHP